MKAKELIAELQQLDPEREVFIERDGEVFEIEVLPEEHHETVGDGENVYACALLVRGRSCGSKL